MTARIKNIDPKDFNLIIRLAHKYSYNIRIHKVRRHIVRIDIYDANPCKVPVFIENLGYDSHLSLELVP